jgi:DNA-binding LytR/AlgR family response regulator
MTTALIAEDECLLADELKEELAHLWPELILCAQVSDGFAALAAIERDRPDVLFLDVEMPGLSGIEIARLSGGRSHVIFITAFDRYAIQAFEEGAIDYVLKPLEPARLARAVQRVKERLGRAPADLSKLVDRFKEAPLRPDLLRWITVLNGQEIRLITIDDVICFEADNKYVAVVTADGDSLITTPLKELIAGLDPSVFWQIHRGTIVNVNAIESVRRLPGGKLEVHLKKVARKLAVSDRFAHLFRQM